MDVKALQGYMKSLGFIPSLAKPELGKEVGKRSERSNFFETPRKRAYQKGKIESSEQSKEGSQLK